jgi:hypothetical protein
MSGKAVSPRLNLQKFLQREVRKEIATDLIEWNDGLAIVLRHRQMWVTRRLRFEVEMKCVRMPWIPIAPVGPISGWFKKLQLND